MREAQERAVSYGIAIGFVLVLLGVIAYVVSDFASVTALIPSALGVVVVLLGLAAKETDYTQESLYGMGLLGLLGVLGSARAVPEIVDLLTGGSVDSEIALAAQAGTILLGLALLVVVAAPVYRDR